jgi:hypothetical protein
MVMQQERRTKLLARVGKLLRQADGTSFKEEAETAILMAQRILAENGMTMEEVDALSHEEQKKLGANEQMVTMGHRHSEWLLSLARVICRQFRTKHYINHTGWGAQEKHHIRIVGLAEDVAICRDVYTYARETAERLAKAYAKQAHRDPIRHIARDLDPIWPHQRYLQPIEWEVLRRVDGETAACDLVDGLVGRHADGAPIITALWRLHVEGFVLFFRP